VKAPTQPKLKKVWVDVTVHPGGKITHKVVKGKAASKKR
jgi:hypothetical protein